MEITIENEAIQDFRSMVQIGYIVYFLSNCGKELWSFDIQKKTFRKKKVLSNKMCKYAAYRKVIRYNDLLVLVPGSADDICIYDSQKEFIRRCPIPDINISYNEQCKFSNAFCRDNRIFFLPFCYPEILVVDTENWKVSNYNIVYVGEKVIKSELFSGSYVLQQDKCYIPSVRSNEVLEIDINMYTVKKYNLGKEAAWYGSISFDGNNFWLTGGKNTITKWDAIHNKTVEYAYPPNFIKADGGYPFLDSFQWMNRVMLIPVKSNMFVSIDIGTENVTGIPRKMSGNLCSLLNYAENNISKLLCDTTQAKLIFMEGNQKKIEQMRIGSCFNVYIDELINSNFSVNAADKDYYENLCGNKIYSICNQ